MLNWCSDAVNEASTKLTSHKMISTNAGVLGRVPSLASNCRFPLFPSSFVLGESVEARTILYLLVFTTKRSAIQRHNFEHNTSNMAEKITDRQIRIVYAFPKFPYSTALTQHHSTYTVLLQTYRTLTSLLFIY